MNLAAFKSTISQKLNFQYQQIVDFKKRPQNWIEMLYRPQHMMGYQNVDLYFKSLNTQQKVDLDIQIFDQLPDILNTQKPRRLSVNLMPNSLLSGDFRQKFSQLMQTRAIDPQNICIEIIETQSMPPLCSSALDLLKVFRSHGGWVALDDFGSGFAHWELLQTGMIDVIKVASQNLTHHAVGYDYILGLSRFAECMNINTVLEGVETEEDYIRGKTQGFHNFQGWLFK